MDDDSSVSSSSTSSTSSSSVDINKLPSYKLVKLFYETLKKDDDDLFYNIVSEFNRRMEWIEGVYYNSDNEQEDDPPEIPDELSPIDVHFHFLGFVRIDKVMDILLKNVKTTKILDYMIDSEETQYEQVRICIGEDWVQTIPILLFLDSWTIEEKSARIRWLYEHVEHPADAKSQTIVLDCSDEDYLPMMNISHLQFLMDTAEWLSIQYDVKININVDRVCQLLWEFDDPGNNQYLLRRTLTVWLFLSVLPSNKLIQILKNFRVDDRVDTRKRIELLGKLLVRDVYPMMGHQDIPWALVIRAYEKAGADALLYHILKKEIAEVWWMCELGFYISNKKLIKNLHYARHARQGYNYARLLHDIQVLLVWYCPNFLYIQRNEDSIRNAYHEELSVFIPPDNVYTIQDAITWQHFSSMAAEASRADMTYFELTMYGSDLNTERTNFPYFVLSNTVMRQTNVYLGNAVLAIPNIPAFLENDQVPETPNSFLNRETYATMKQALAAQKHSLRFLSCIHRLEVMEKWVEFRKDSLQRKKEEEQKQDERSRARRQEYQGGHL
jgi:hypothetical protein